MARARITNWGRSKIVAIKHVRQLSGQGLKEAKDTVEGAQWFEFQASPHHLAVLEQLRAQGCGVEIENLGLSAGPGESAAQAPPSDAVVLRYLSGPKKIHAIKLVRELDSSLGLKAAKELVEQQGTVMRLLSRKDAQRWAHNFAAIDSRVELLPAPSTMLSSAPDAFDTPKPEPADDDEDDFDF